MKEGQTLSKTKMIKLLTKKTQTMWDKKEKTFKQIALTTRYDGQEVTITTAKESAGYLFIKGNSETQEFRLTLDKKKEVVSGSILPIDWRENTQ